MKFGLLECKDTALSGWQIPIFSLSILSDILERFFVCSKLGTTYAARSVSSAVLL